MVDVEFSTGLLLGGGDAKSFDLLIGFPSCQVFAHGDAVGGVLCAEVESGDGLFEGLCNIGFLADRLGLGSFLFFFLFFKHRLYICAGFLHLCNILCDDGCDDVCFRIGL